MPPVYVKIYSGTPLSVMAVKDALNSVNIIPIIKNEAESARLAGFAAPSDLQQVYVHPDELEIANNTLRSVPL